MKKNTLPKRPFITRKGSNNNSLKRKKRNKIKFEGDTTLLILIGIMVIFGVIMVYDATTIYALGTLGDANQLFYQQVAWVTAGVLVFTLFYKLNLETIRRISLPLFMVSMFFLFILAVFGVLPCSLNVILSPCINGANRWLYLNPSPFPQIPVLGTLGFQPSEFAKLTLIIYLAALLDKHQAGMFFKSSNFKGSKSNYDLFFTTLLVTGLVSFLVFLQPNMSTATLIFLIGFSMYFVSEATLTPFFVMLPVLGISGILTVISSDYRRQRLMTFLGSDSSDLSTGYHIKQIMIALGSGGFLGMGFGQSRQKFHYLPEVAADSIFAIIGEELGLLGTFGVVLLFTFFIYKGFEVAKNSDTLMGRFIAVGVTSWIGLQFFINVAAMVKLIPLTGIPIPLISYGGSSTVFSMMGLGLLCNVSRGQNRV